MGIKSITKIIFLSLFLTGCATSPLENSDILRIINNRFNNIEEKLNTNPPGIKNREEITAKAFQESTVTNSEKIVKNTEVENKQKESKENNTSIIIASFVFSLLCLIIIEVSRHIK